MSVQGSVELPIAVRSESELAAIVNANAFGSGTVVYVIDDQTSFRFVAATDPGGGATPAAGSVVAATGGGVWVADGSRATGLVTQAAWFVDFANGNDGNDGQTAATALKTDRERQRRWGFGLQPQIRVNTKITYICDGGLGNLDSDVINLSAVLSPGPTATLPFNLEIVVPSLVVIATGTIGAVVPLDWATDQRLRVFDAGQPDFSSYQTKQLRLTSGAHVGARAWIAEDQGAGLHAAFLSPMQLEDPLDPTVFTFVTPAVGDHYEILDVPFLYFGTVRVEQGDGVELIPDNGSVIFRDMFLAGNSVASFSNLLFQFHNCACGDLTFQTYRSNLYNCWAVSNGGEFGGQTPAINGGSVSMFGGMISSPWVVKAGTLLLDFNVLSQGLLGLYSGATAIVYPAGEVLIGAAASFNANASALTLWDGASGALQPLGDPQTRWWGTGNNSALGMGAGCDFTLYQLPTINNGEPSVIIISGFAKVWADVPVYTGAASSQVPSSLAFGDSTEPYPVP